MKYVFNTGKTGRNVQIYYDDPSGEKGLGGTVKQLHAIFRPERYSALENRVEDTGYTPIDDETYASLCRVKSFNYAVNEQWLEIFDELPDSVQTPTDALQKALQENVALKQKIAQLEAGTESAELETEVTNLTEQLKAVEGDLSDAQDKVVGLEGDLNDAKTQLETTMAEKETMITQNAELTSQLEAAQTSLANDQEQLTALQSQVTDLTAQLEAAKKSGV